MHLSIETVTLKREARSSFTYNRSGTAGEVLCFKRQPMAGAFASSLYLASIGGLYEVYEERRRGERLCAASVFEMHHRTAQVQSRLFQELGIHGSEESLLDENSRPTRQDRYRMEGSHERSSRRRSEQAGTCGEGPSTGAHGSQFERTESGAATMRNFVLSGEEIVSRSSRNHRLLDDAGKKPYSEWQTKFEIIIREKISRSLKDHEQGLIKHIIQ